MKMKFKKALFAKRPSYLRITLNKGEKLNYMAAQWLVQYAENVFLPCVYKERDRSTLLFYDLREALPLKTFVKAGLSLGQYERLLYDLYESISIITSLQREPTCLVTDPAFVFVREGTHLQFVFVPVAHKLKDNVFTPLDLLLWLSDKEHLQMVLASDERKQDALYAWTQTQSVFSLAYFKAFLDKEFPRKEQDKHPRYSYTDVYDEKCAQRALIDPVFLATGVKTTYPSVTEKLNEAPYASQEYAHGGFVSQDGVTQSTSAPCTNEMSTASATFDRAIGEIPVQGACSLLRLKDNTSYPLASGTSILGRSRKADIILVGNTDISREHAALRFTGKDELILTDLGSANGTWVDKVRLVPQMPVSLKRGDSFRLAHEWFQIV